MASNLADRFSTLHEIVRAARTNLAPGPWDYLIGGAETETTLRRNRQALDSLAFRPRVRRDDAWVDDWVRRAADHGYAAFCLTVDTACYSRRERDLARRFVKPWRTRAAGFEFQAGLNWDHVKRFKDTHAIPLILKGIATAEDATLAIEHGVEGVYVSNHGGRQLDHGRGAIDALPEVVEAVGG